VRLAPVGGTVVSKLTAEGVARFSFLTGPTPQSSSGCIIPYEKGRSFHPLRKGEELPMSEDALRGWYWTGVVVFALALWIIWYMVAKM
jgi:hypothetical protein